ncbi:hypothetical protein KC19_2G110100 [Ceratodon purpureus]|uniref:Uncharacterized protein n=1 Tax=Ceratodon purpureus TaxID=3225 RepID=A0A8T0ISK4_CERPU|nr:hypothetical protein KC19_2G110100 [Ceratodon purpureus]
MTSRHSLQSDTELSHEQSRIPTKPPRIPSSVVYVSQDHAYKRIIDQHFCAHPFHILQYKRRIVGTFTPKLPTSRVEDNQSLGVSVSEIIVNAKPDGSQPSCIALRLMLSE